MEHSSRTPFSTTGFLLSQPDYSDVLLDASVDQEVNRWEKEANGLSQSDALKLINHARRQGRQILDKIRQMRLCGCSADEIACVVKSSIASMNIEISQFRDSLVSFDRNKQSVMNGMRDTDKKIKDLNFSFDTFGSDLPDLPPAVKAVGKMYLKKNIEQRLGKGPAEAAVKLEKFFSMKVPEESENPWRYRVISFGVQYGMTEGLALFLPAGLPVYAAMNACHGVAYGAEQLKPILKKMQTDIEVHHWWIHQFESTGDGVSFMGSITLGQGMLELAKVPSICLKTIQHELMDACNAICDAIHLTDANVKRIACLTLKHIAKNSPEALEEQMWCRAAEDIKK